MNDAASRLAPPPARSSCRGARCALRAFHGLTGRLKRGYGGYAPHGGAAVAVAPITSRGAAVADSLNGPARHVKPDVLTGRLSRLGSDNPCPIFYANMKIIMWITTNGRLYIV